MKFFFFLIFFIQSSYALECSHFAHASEIESPADACANIFQATQKAFLQSKLKADCPGWPNLELIALGRPLGDKVKFLAFDNEKYLIQVHCQESVYNQTMVFFYYDAKRIVLGKRENPVHDPMSLVLFPVDPQISNSPAYEAKIAVKDFNKKTLMLTSYLKGLADGSIGTYAQYVLNKNTALPELKLTVTKSDQDHQAGYKFTNKHPPRGKGWKTLIPKKTLIGCLTSLDNLTCLSR
jgi:hypothetical protein